LADGLDESWTPLFNGTDLQGWYTYLDQHGKNNDPDSIFTVEDGVIHVYKHSDDGAAVPIGFISTETEYSHYHLRFQYMWGTKRFGERAQMKRDAGVMYHCVGPDGVLQNTWPRCFECQVQEGDTGDALCLAGARYTTWIDPDAAELPESVEGKYRAASEGGVPFQASQWVARDEQRDQLEGWNTVDVIVMGNDYAVHMVNGRVNNRISLLEQRVDDSNWAALSGGRIVLQAELAEVYYRDIKIKPISTGPFRPKGTVLITDERGVFQLHARDATLQGPSLRFQPDENQTLGHWHDANDSASWIIQVDEPGEYEVEFEWAIDDGAAVNSVQVIVGDSRMQAKVPGTGGWWTYRTEKFGRLTLKSGRQTLTVSPVGEFQGALMDLRRLRLKPLN
jgi:hypothetical protein